MTFSNALLEEGWVLESCHLGHEVAEAPLGLVNAHTRLCSFSQHLHFSFLKILFIAFRIVFQALVRQLVMA